MRYLIQLWLTYEIPGIACKEQHWTHFVGSRLSSGGHNTDMTMP